MKAPKINVAAIDLLARVFNSHKKGVPEWMKNAREAYLREGVPKDRRHVVLHLVQKGGTDTRLECIDFVGVSGADIETRYLEWANPDSAKQGLKPGEAEGGQGNGGKAYLRQMFQRGYFVSIRNGKLSVVSFIDEKKYALDFVPSEKDGKDIDGDSPALKGIRKYASQWLEAFRLPPDHNITIVRGVGPVKPIDSEQMTTDILQFPQARETIRACEVDLWVNHEFKRQLKVIEPTLHPAFSTPFKIAVPAMLKRHGVDIPTQRLPGFPPGELILSVADRPLHGQALASWNRIDFHGAGVAVIGYRAVEEFSLTQGQFGRYLFGRCTVPLLTTPEETYELQGRIHLNDGPLSEALYDFIATEADKILAQLAKTLSSTAATKKRKNLEKLNQRLSSWIESKLQSLRGLTETGAGVGGGKSGRKSPSTKVHAPAIMLKVHREQLPICKAVTYQLRAVAYDANKRPVPPGRLTWKSQNAKVASVHPERGLLRGESAGMALVTVVNDAGLASQPVMVQVHEVERLILKTPSPATVGSNRRLPIALTAKTTGGKTIKDPAVNWKSDDDRIATVGQDGTLIGGEVGDAHVYAYAGDITSDALDIVVEKGAAGKPKGGGKGKPLVLISSQDLCPFDQSTVLLNPTDPPVYQRPFKPDYDNNVFWINLQHPLADELLKAGEASIRWRTFHFERLVDVFTILEMRHKFADSETLDVDQVLDEIHVVAAEIYASAKDELFDVLYNDTIDFAKLDG